MTVPNIAGQTPLLSINHTDGISDTGNATDGITTNKTPFVTGYSEQSAYGNVVTVRIYDQTPNSPTFGHLVGLGTTDGFGKFNIQILKYDASGNLILDGTGNPQPADLFQYNGQKILGVQATDAAGTVGNFTLVGDSLSPIYLQLNAPNPATIVLDPAADSGQSNSDNITNPGLATINQGQLTFDVTVDGTVVNGSVVTPTAQLMRLNENGVYVPVGSSVPITAGALGQPISLNLVDPGPFQDGYAYTYAVKITNALGDVYDPNGDPQASDLAIPHTVTVSIDSTPPTASNVLVKLSTGSDSGLSTTDNVTNPVLIPTNNGATPPQTNGSLTFQVQVPSADRNATLTLMRATVDPNTGQTTFTPVGQTVVANGLPDPVTGQISAVLSDPGPWNATTLGGDQFYYFLKIVDVAGNAYDPSDPTNVPDPLGTAPNTSVVVSSVPPGQAQPTTTAPTTSGGPTVIMLDPNSDAGTQGDNTTNPIQVTPLNTLYFDVYLPASEQNAKVTLMRDGQPIGTPVYAIGTPDPVTHMILVKVFDPGPFTGGTSTNDGTGSYFYNYTVKIQDVAGNLDYDPNNLNATASQKTQRSSSEDHHRRRRPEPGRADALQRLRHGALDHRPHHQPSADAGQRPASVPGRARPEQSRPDHQRHRGHRLPVAILRRRQDLRQGRQLGHHGAGQWPAHRDSDRSWYVRLHRHRA